MNIKDFFKRLTPFEWVLWVGSVAVITVSYILAGKYEILTLIASALGVTALIFTAKGNVIGPVILIVFSLIYGVISFTQQYYGEIFTYVGMSAPVSAVSVITWLKNPYSSSEVKISKVTAKTMTVLLIATAVVTVLFYFILKWCGTASLILSTISVTTSFLASMLTVLRSPLYAAAYALNDIVLIVLWIIASIDDASCVPMIVCFAVFFINDLYGLKNWLKMQKEQG
ncbi:MAG: nicotinamide mononucleotide transporter [Ruminococcus sp.]|nr:nicotinamide mononucleotide transporter [Ruminococcus sp.]